MEVDSPYSHQEYSTDFDAYPDLDTSRDREREKEIVNALATAFEEDFLEKEKERRMSSPIHFHRGDFDYGLGRH